MIEPIVYFGTVNEDEEIDWREANIIDDPDDDEDRPATADVIGMLGFDPDDYDEDGKFKREKMYDLFNKADILLGEVETKAKHPAKSSNLPLASPEQISKDFIRRTEEYEKKWVKKAQDIFTRQGKEVVKNVEPLTQKEIDGYIIRKALEVEDDKPILCLDFDDTLFDTETEKPIEGSLDFVNSVVDIFDVQILSGRSATKAGRDEMKEWLKANDFPVKISFPEHKPSVDVMLDDRAITFTGTYPTVEELQDFIPWNKKELQIVYVSKGGPGSGNFGHTGRPGLVGGSGMGGNRGHIDEDEFYKIKLGISSWIEKDTGFGKEKSIEIKEAFSRFSGAACKAVRNGSLIKENTLIEEYIAKAPKWGNKYGPLYRGLSIPTDTKVGDTIKMNGLSSWSSDKSVANKFEGYKTTNPVILVLDKGSNKAVSIVHISNVWPEKEVVLSKRAENLRVTKIETSLREKSIYHVQEV